jgi:hypothetical protein
MTHEGAAMTNSDVASGPDPVAPLDEQPYPPRFWWLKRIAVAWVLVHAAVLGLRIWWGWEAERRWQAAVDRMHETELPSKSASDGSLPDELNLAFVVHAAATKLSLTKENGDFMDMGEFLDGSFSKGANSRPMTCALLTCCGRTTPSRCV